MKFNLSRGFRQLLGLETYLSAGCFKKKDGCSVFTIKPSRQGSENQRLH